MACRSPSSRMAWCICARCLCVRDLGSEVEINSGVKAGDQVILNPAVDLADGSKVRIRAAAAPTS